MTTPPALLPMRPIPRQLEAVPAYGALFLAGLVAPRQPDVPYVAEITATTGQKAVSLGGVTVSTRRLALRWLRRQALRLADSHGYDVPPDAAWLCAKHARSVAFHSSDAPEALRAWADDQARQDQSIARLEAGYTDVLTVADPAVGLRVTLTVWPVRSSRAVGD